MVHNGGLMDLQFIGCRFTWTNRMIFYKLNRVMVKTHWWLLEVFRGYVEFLPSGCLLDHSCFVVSILPEERKPARPLKFFNMWTLHADFQRLVTNVRADIVSDIAQFKLK